MSHSNGSTSAAADDLAAAYQPRRAWAATVSIAWNLMLITAFVGEGGHWRFYCWLSQRAGLSQSPHWISLFYLAGAFAAYALANYPIELWFGYLQERQFGLAKDGVRAWTRDWAVGTLQHGLLFCLGSGLILLVQGLWPMTWLLWVAMLLMVLFLLTSYLAGNLLPKGLFHFDSPDEATTRRVALLAGNVSLPPVTIFTSASPRGFSGGIIGLGDRQKLLLSRSTLAAASDSVLRFVLRHDAGHRHYHHNLLATLTGWAWVVLGLTVSERIIFHWSPESLGLPPFILWLALTMSFWMAGGEPLLAYLGRRMEYQADRYYLRHGGTIEEMQRALEELSHRNLARTESQRRRETIFHPLPSVWNRLYAGRRYAQALNLSNGLPADTKVLQPDGAT